MSFNLMLNTVVSSKLPEEKLNTLYILRIEHISTHLPLSAYVLTNKFCSRESCSKCNILNLSISQRL